MIHCAGLTGKAIWRCRDGFASLFIEKWWFVILLVWLGLVWLVTVSIIGLQG